MQAVSEDGETATVQKGMVVASDEKAARAQVLDDHWDPRLEAASTWASLVLKPLDDELDPEIE